MLAGPASRQPIILLHGFPDFWIGWRRQIDALAPAGFRVIVPDKRGYYTSAKPKGIPGYTLLKLVGDVERSRMPSASNDFTLSNTIGAASLPRLLGAKLPHRLDKLVVLNEPHHEVLLAHALRQPAPTLPSLTNRTNGKFRAATAVAR